MLRGLSGFLAGRSVPTHPTVPPGPPGLWELGSRAANLLSADRADRRAARRGARTAIPHRRLAGLNTEDLARWVVAHYPRRSYPVVFVGAAHGAATHLAAALGAPWLPQTLPLPIRHDPPGTPSSPPRASANAFLADNPDVALFESGREAGREPLWMKWHRMPAAYTHFLARHTAQGATVVVVDCRRLTATTTLGERHFRQHTPDEPVNGPEPDHHGPDARWGFEWRLAQPLTALAAEHGWSTRVLSFDQPEPLSASVARLYRAWYAQSGLPSDRLLTEIGPLLDPWSALRTASVPYWLPDSSESSAHAMHAFLDSSPAFDEIRLMLHSPGGTARDTAPAARWRSLVHRATRTGDLLGAAVNAYPRDHTCLIRAQRRLARLRDTYPPPEPLAVSDVDAFLDERTEPAWGCHTRR